MTSAVAIFSPKRQLPSYTPNTPIYVNEGDGITGWTTTNGTISNPSASVLRLTKTTASGAGAASITRSITLPASTKNYVMYGKTKANRTTGDSCTIRIREGAANFQVQFNWNAVTGLAQLDCVSCTGTTGVNTYQNAVVRTDWDSEADYYEWAIVYRGRLEFYVKLADGWNIIAQTACKAFGAAATLGILIDTASASGSWVEFDHIQVDKPHQAIGDSITLGNPGYTSFDISGYNNTYMRTAYVYPNQRNNIIANKGANGNTSAQVAARINADVITHGPKVCFLGVCNNDYGSISLADRTTNIQASVNLLVAAGIKVVLIGAVRRVQSDGSNPGYRTYYDTWWQQYRGTLTGVDAAINIAEAVADSTGYHDPALTPDGGHNNVTGASRTGRHIARLPYT